MNDSQMLQELCDERDAFERDEALARREFGVEFGEDPEAVEAVLSERLSPYKLQELANSSADFDDKCAAEMFARMGRDSE